MKERTVTKYIQVRIQHTCFLFLHENYCTAVQKRGRDMLILEEEIMERWFASVLFPFIVEYKGDLGLVQICQWSTDRDERDV
jgi:hypothetical protein